MFKAYKRLNGAVGIRNKVLILPSVACSGETAKVIASQVSGAVTLNNPVGCGQIGADAVRTFQVLAGLGKNPNVFGVLVVGLGCETIQPRKLAAEIRTSQKPVEVVVIQEEGGTLEAQVKGVRLAAAMVQEMSRQQKEDCSPADLVVALECGGSDPTSGIAANPAVGVASDLIIAQGGTAILSETTEFIGAEHVFVRRAASEALGGEVLKMVKRLEDSVECFGGNLRGGNPAPGNIAGGISTIEEKSLGCIQKGGKSPFQEVVEYGVVPSCRGLVVMDSPGFDIDSLTGMVSAGAQVSLFTTGRGTPVGNPIIPVIKISGNTNTYKKMLDNMDIDAGSILTNDKSVKEIGRRIYEEILEVAGGKMTKAEVYGFSESSIWRCGLSV